MRLPRFLALGIMAVFLLLPGLFAAAPHSYAWESWCEDDPAIQVEGQPIIFATSIPTAALAALQGPAQFTLTLPANVDGQPLSNDPRSFPDNVVVTHSDRVWNGKGAIPIEVALFVPGSQGFPVQLQIKKPNVPITNVMAGAANQTLSRQLELPAALLKGH